MKQFQAKFLQSLRFPIKKSQVFLTSSPRNTCQIQQWYLLPPPRAFLAGNCGDRTKSFDSFERRREEQSHSRSWKRSATGQASGWKARRIRQQLLRGTVPPVSTGSRTGLTKDSWHCLQPLPASRACTNWALFLKVATGWAVLSGSRAGNHREKWISWSSPQGAKLLLVPSRPARGQGHQQCCVTQGPHAGAAQGSHFTQGSQEEALGYFQLTYRSVPLIFSAIKEENKQNQRLACALSYNGVTLSFKTSKNWKPDKSGLPTHFLFSYRKTHDFQTKACGMQLV